MHLFAILKKNKYDLKKKKKATQAHTLLAKHIESTSKINLGIQGWGNTTHIAYVLYVYTEDIIC